MHSHVRRTMSCCFATLRQLRIIWRQVPTTVFQSLATALVLPHLDYCNSVLCGLPTSLIRRLQSVQNATTRLIFGIRRPEHISLALISLHWLRIPERISFKLPVLTYRTIHGAGLSYLQPCFTRVAITVVFCCDVVNDHTGCMVYLTNYAINLILILYSPFIIIIWLSG